MPSGKKRKSSLKTTFLCLEKKLYLVGRNILKIFYQLNLERSLNFDFSIYVLKSNGYFT